ncbi:TIGR01777 family oxidoreductase [Bacillus sp. 31A1R]|uniref:TIGR01777 family oxidoreductase n=1 Tax=Robertmurraya mangrovi TaxID=3098077 RepID=A0ABU5J5D4_9BACI|nr:TIGR01777 family oxidoreductase [Bacillus sp. 31A1R]MDZ5474565.1 TIGR01777 family oxidoreductase [Bacillus sp. 31A1R]
MRVAIAGGTGFVGESLTGELVKQGHEVFILTRKKKESNSKNVSYIKWLNDGDHPAKDLREIDAIINLAGESINSGRWTEERKNRILNSRIRATEEILKIIKNLAITPKVLINASAVGYYGTSLNNTFTETSPSQGNDFLATTVKAWEQKAAEAAQHNVRTVFCRFGIILDKNEGALPRIALPYQLFAGGTVGSGEQWVSWIHLKDVIQGILFALENENLIGPVNFTAPKPLTMKEFGKTLGTVLNRPHWIPAPSFALKLLLGEMSTLVLEGQKVLPNKLLEAGYHFQFPELETALSNIYGK